MPEKPATPTNQESWGQLLACVFISFIGPLSLVLAAFKWVNEQGWPEGQVWIARAVLVGSLFATWWLLSLPIVQELRRLRSAARNAAPAPEPGTASVTPGRDGGLLAIGLFVLFLLVVVFSIDFLPQWRANCSYVEARCVLLDKRVYEDPDGGLYRPEFLIRYEAGGRPHEAWAYTAVQSASAWRWPKERFLERFAVGEEYPCWYDPADPSRVMFVRDYSWLSYGGLVALVAVAFLTGIGALRRMGEAGRAAEEVSGRRPGPGRAGVCTAPRLGASASVNVTPAAAAAGPGVRRPSVGVTAAPAGHRPGPPPDATRRLLGRLAAPLIHTLPFGLLAGGGWAWFTGGAVWYGLTVGGLIGLAFGVVVGVADWLRNGR